MNLPNVMLRVGYVCPTTRLYTIPFPFFHVHFLCFVGSAVRVTALLVNPFHMRPRPAHDFIFRSEKLLHCTSWVAYCDCDTCVNKKLWRIMDAAFDHCDVSLAIQLKSGARSRKVTEKRLVGQAVKNYDRLWAVGSKMREEARVSVFVTPDLKDRKSLLPPPQLQWLRSM
jgi:hypothetical protein